MFANRFDGNIETNNFNATLGHNMFFDITNYLLEVGTAVRRYNIVYTNNPDRFCSVGIVEKYQIICV